MKNLNDFLINILAISSILLAILALESKKILHSIIFLWILVLVIGVTYFLLFAFYASLFQIFLYGGVLIVLILIFIMLYENEDMNIQVTGQISTHSDENSVIQSTDFNEEDR